MKLKRRSSVVVTRLLLPMVVKHEGLVLYHHTSAEEDVNVVVGFEVGRAVKNVDARQVELGVLDKLDDQWHVVLLEAKFVQLRVCLIEVKSVVDRGTNQFSTFSSIVISQVCGHKIDFHRGNEKKMVAGAKKERSPPGSRTSRV